MTWRPTVVVVPCYNEERRLDMDRFLDFGHAHDDVGFLFVDDGSVDGTAGALAEAAEAHPERVRFVSSDVNRGKAEAVRTGLRRAIEGGARNAGYWDADLATPLEELTGMLRVLGENAGLLGVLGSRVRLLGRTIHRDPVRHYLGRVFATAASLRLGMPVYDTQCGAKLFRVQGPLEQALERPFRTRWIFDVELLARLRDGCDGDVAHRLEEYPLRSWTDVDGSKLRTRDFMASAWDLVRIPKAGARTVPGDPRARSDTG